MKMALHLCDPPPPNQQPHPTGEKRRSLRVGRPPPCLTSAPQNCQGRQTPGKVRHCHSEEESKETGQLTAMCHFETKKNTR